MSLTKRGCYFSHRAGGDLITFITIIFGELVPKRIGQLYPETVARWVSRPMVWLATRRQAVCQACSRATPRHAQAVAH